MIRSALSQFQNEKKKAISIKFQANALNITKTMYFIISSSTEGYYIGRLGVIGGAEFYKIGQIRTKRWGCAFHFVEIQCVFCRCFQNGLEFFYETWQLWSKVQLDHFKITLLEIWNICACANCSLLHIFYKLLDMIWIWNKLGKPLW